MEIVIRTTSDNSGLDRAKADAAKAGAEAGKAYAAAFDAAAHGQASNEAGGIHPAVAATAGTAGLIGTDPALLRKLESEATQPGGIGILGTGNDATLRNMLRNILSKGDVGLLAGTEKSLGGGAAPVATANTAASDALLVGLAKVLKQDQGPQAMDIAQQTILQKLAGQGAHNQTTTDTILQSLAGEGPKNTTTTDTILQKLMGKGPENATTTDFIDTVVDPASLSNALRGISDGVKKANESVNITVGTGDDAARIDVVAAALDKLKASAVEADGTMGFASQRVENLIADLISLGSASGTDSARMDAVTAALTSLGDVSGQDDDSVSGLASAFASLKNSLAAPFVLLGQTAAGLANLRSNADAAAGSGGGGGILGVTAATGGWMGGLSATIPILGLTVKSVALWHVALDGVIEALISVGLATAAAALGAASMAPAVNNIYDHLTAVNDVGSSLNSTVLPKLDQQFDALGESMAPQTVEAYGGALNLAGNKLSSLGAIAHQVVNLFDDWIAKIDAWASGQGFTKFLEAGIGYLSQFGKILGTVGVALGDLMTKDPGIAHYLLDIIGGVAKLLELFSELPAPIVEGTLALHGLYVWGSFLVPILISVANGITGMTLALLALPANPLFWVAAAAVALVLLATNMGKADSATRSFIAGIENKINNDSASSAILDIASSVGQLDQKVQAASGAQGIAQFNKELSSWGGAFTTLDDQLQASGHQFGLFFGSLASKTPSEMISGLGHLGQAFKDLVTPSSGATVAIANNMKALDGEISKLIDEEGTLFRVAGTLVAQHYTMAQALAIEDLAGVKANDTYDIARQKVDNLITGYQALGVQAGILANSVNAVTFQTELQDSKISAVTGAWDNFFKIVSGGASGLVGFLQQTSGLYQSLGAGAATLSVSNGKASISFKSLSSGAAAGATSMNGVNTASLNAQAAFISAAQAAQTQADNLMTLSAAGGDGSKGTDLVTSSVKDMVAELLPASKGSSDFTTILYALAQQGGYHGADSFKALSSWVTTASGSISAAKNPTSQLQGNTDQLAKSAGNLTTDVQNLSLALGSGLTGAEAAAIQLARGGTKPFDDFANAVVQTGASSTTTKNAAIKLGDEFLALSLNNVPQAKTQFESFAVGGLGLTKTQADALWQDVLNKGIPALDQTGNQAAVAMGKFVDLAKGGLNLTTGQAQTLWNMFSQQNLDIMAKKAGGAEGQFIALAMNGLNLTTSQAHQLWDMFVQQKLDEAGTKAGETRGQFERLAGQLGLTKTAADKLWGSLHQVAAGSPYAARLTMVGAGTYTINTPVVSGSIGPNGNFLPGGAAGGVLPGYAPGQDTVLAALSPGEGILVPEAVRAIGPATVLALNKAHSGGRRSSGMAFSGGGVLSGSVPASSVYGTNPDAPQRMFNVFGDSLERSLALAMQKAEIAAQSAIGSGGDIVSYALSFLGKIPYVWGGTSLSSAGADCSGFTGSVYRHFGYNPPRTSEAQSAWVKNTSSPEAGGLAFYYSPAGGPTPGHVAIIQDANTVISQGGGMGPTLMGLHGMPLTSMGIPPSGFSSGSVPGVSGSVVSWITQALKDAGEPASWLPDLEILVSKESGGNPNAKNASGATGLFQTMAGTYAEFATVPGGMTNPVSDAVAGIRYIASQYGAPWNIPGLVSGTYRGYDSGGWLPTGTSVAVNNTGRPEQVLAPGQSGGGGTLQIEWTGTSGGDELLAFIRKNIRIRGGNVQSVLGR